MNMGRIGNSQGVMLCQNQGVYGVRVLRVGNGQGVVLRQNYGICGMRVRGVSNDQDIVLRQGRTVRRMQLLCILDGKRHRTRLVSLYHHIVCRMQL